MARQAVCLAILSVFLGFAWASSETLSREQHIELLQQAKTQPNDAFTAWVKRFDKVYTGVEEYERRLEVWLDNMEYALEYNAKVSTHWLGLNVFADLSLEEFKQYSLGYRADLKPARLGSEFVYENVSLDGLPKAIDWVAKGAVTKVKNQMQCGSCWAFSTTGAVEGINQIVTGELLVVSEQELIDCDTTRDHGCHGGLMDFAFEWIISNKGVDVEKDYPYKALEGTCLTDKRDHKVVTIDGYQDINFGSETDLMKATAHQPVSVAIEADQRNFQLYQGGVFDDATCGTQLDHGVLVVGYGEEDGKKFWLVKNSWGAEWGDKGYIKLERGIDAPEGRCGIAMQPSFPIKKGPNPPAPPPSPPKPPGPEPGPPGPQPEQCDDVTECPAGNTCCCLRDFFGFCFTWACCPLPKATCCDDHLHCCPHNLPVCDTVGGRCLKAPGVWEGSVPISTKQPAQRTHNQPRWPFQWPSAHKTNGEDSQPLVA